MAKEYTKDINSFEELEKVLNDWFTVLKWNVLLSYAELTSLASLSKFTYSVEWYFYCFFNKLTTLEWCPQKVGWDFMCYCNRLTTLKWCPVSVGWMFSCYANNLITLDGCPVYVGWDVLCYKNKFTPLEKKIWKYNFFQRWEDIYIKNSNINNKDIKILIECDLWVVDDGVDKLLELSTKYYDSYINLTKSTTKINKQDITETNIILKWKKFKRQVLGL
jgi:hypothetical protein